MDQVRVALVCPQESLRMAAARAFDDAPSGWDVTLHRTPPDDADVLVAAGCEVDGAILFDPARPTRVVEEVKARVAQANHRLITVVRASGGCGGTAVALHLAAAASRATVLVSPEPSALAFRLGLDPDTMDPTPVPVPGGFKVAAAQQDAFVPTVSDLVDRFEAVIVDGDHATPPSIIVRSHACILVLNPTVPSARRAVKFLEAFPDAAWAVVANRLGPGGETTAAELQRILGRRVTLELPCSRGLRDAEGEGRLLSSWVPWRRRVERLAHAVDLR